MSERPRLLEQHEQAFLLAEFEQAWAQVLNIDERRLKFVEYYSAIVAAILAVAANLAVDRELTVPIGLLVTALLTAGVLIGAAFVFMILSERAANRRYREKINLIRGLFLTESTHPGMTEYLARKDLGVKTGADAQPDRLGRTLKGVLVFMGLEIALVVVVAIATWWGIVNGYSLA